MANGFKKHKKSIKVKKTETASSEAINTPHWIHHTQEDPSFINGIRYLPICDCSECGFTVNAERKKCPHCGVEMW